MTDHPILCRCAECLEKALAHEKQEVQALRHMLRKREYSWAKMSDQAIIGLWQVCRINIHLGDPNEGALRFGKAMEHALHELNWYAFCVEAREEL